MSAGILLGMQDYRKLQVWQKSHPLAMEILRESRRFRASDVVAIRGQLQRSAASIPANIVEGSFASTNPEFARFLDIALKSAGEAHYHLLAARDLGALSPARHRGLSERLEEVQRMLFVLARRVRDSAT